ncbi:MAG TPA: aminotransferase class V-fold PLP-dependent enzyme [Candidatus Limnocylindria bacterium]|nr:aminotransferase class V-fold PLP-dependent enzyme [Candidatus Limnocylindria bacterium]
MSAAPDPAAFRAEFPVFQERSYLNAGSEGPIPRRAVEAVTRRVQEEARSGRSGHDYIEGVIELADQMRAAYARILGCAAGQVALTGSTTDGVNTVIAGLDLRPGDEIVTSDEEHPGLLAPLGRARRRQGVSVRVAPFEDVASAASPETRLIACSHVSWVSGRVADVRALAATEVPVLLDAAQALGAIPVDVRELGVDYYAASGQKWLCGPEGSGCLYVRAERLEELLVPWPGYSSVADPANALEFTAAEGTKRLDHGFPVAIRNVWALASLEVFAEAGWDWVHDRARSLAGWLAERLSECGLQVAPRGSSTLVSWKAGDGAATVERLAAEGLIVRSIPGGELIRASVGAWSSEEEVERLAGLAAELA